MNYITVNEASEKWNISTRRICILCKEGRIAGAMKKSRVWMIPENAKKPDDGRKTEIKRGIDPVLLLCNPTYFEIRNIEPSFEDGIICEIQEKYSRGMLEEAFEEVNKYISLFKDECYLFVLCFLKGVLAADLGKMEAYNDALIKIKRMAVDIDSNLMYKMLINYYFDDDESLDVQMLYEEKYEELVPLLSMLIMKKAINRAIKSRLSTDVSGMEIICRETAGKNSPLILAYQHLYLSVYYNIVGNRNLFEYHYNEALAILLPKKWFAPIAEYSATIDMSLLEKVDQEDYINVVKLSETVVSNYMKIGIFDSIAEAPRQSMEINVQIGYKLLQGKTNEEIAQELGISKYKVKKHIDDLCTIIGGNSKKEVCDFIQRNLFV